MDNEQESLALEFMTGKLNRRELIRKAVLLGLGAPAVLALLEACDGRQTQRNGTTETKVVNLASYGGSFNETLRRSFFDELERETDISVNLGSNASLALARLQARSDDPAWDIVELNGGQYEIAVQQGLVLPLDESVDTSRLIPEAVEEYGFTPNYYQFVMAWDQTKIPDEQAPQSWTDFWDTTRYKTKRSLYDNVSDGSLLEAALMADGVPIEEIFPLDVDRALSSLDRLGKENIIWHSTPQEPIQQLTSGEVSLAAAFNGRVYLGRQAGAEIQYTSTESIVAGDKFPVIKGAPNVDAAWKLLNFLATNAEAHGKFMELTQYQSAIPDAMKYVGETLREQLPFTETYEGKVLFKDDEWWAANLEDTLTQFKVWQAS